MGGGSGVGKAATAQRQRAACESMAQNTCSPQQKVLNQSVIDTMKASCEMIQKNDGCDDLRAEITKNSGAAEAAKKLSGCGDKDVCKQSLDWEGMRSECLEGLKRFGKEATDKVIQLGQDIAKSAEETAKCDRNEGGRKQKLYDDYNKTVPEILQISPPKGRWLEEATCGEISRHISGTNLNIQKKYVGLMTAFEQQNPKARTDMSLYKDPDLLNFKSWFIENGEKESAEMRAKLKAISDAFGSVPALLKSLNVKMNCYNDATRAELACHAAAAAVALAVSAVTGTATVNALSALAKASGSLKVAQAILAIEKLDKAEDKLAAAEKAAEKAAREQTIEASLKAQRAARLAEKVKAQREVVLKRMSDMKGEKGDWERQQVVKALGVVDDRTPDQQERMMKAVVDAHNVCADSGFKQYSADCLRKKAKILKDNGFNQAEREYIMRRGIAGKFADGSDGFALSDIKKPIDAPGSQLHGRSSVMNVVLADGKVAQVQIIATKTEAGIIKHTVQSLDGRSIEINETDIIRRSVSLEPKPVSIRGSAYEGKTDLVMERNGTTTTMIITGSEVVDGKIVHTVVYESGGIKHSQKLTEDQMRQELKIAAQAEQPPVVEPPVAATTPTPTATPPTPTPQASTGARGTWEQQVRASGDSNYTNNHGFKKSDMVEGKPVKVRISKMDGVIDADGEISGGVYYNEFTKTYQVKVKHQVGIYQKPHPMAGKPIYEFDSVDIVDIREGVPKPPLPKTEALPVVQKPLDPTLRKPTGDSLYDPKKDYNDQGFGFFNVRKEMDREASSIFSERRIGERTHIEALQREIVDDVRIRNQAKLGDRNAMYVSENGNFADPRFDPKVWYAKIREGAEQGDSNALTALNGRYKHYLDDGAKLHDSARDRIREHVIQKAKAAGKTDEQIAQELNQLNNWMNKYDETVPRNTNFQKAVKAQKEFERIRSDLDLATRSNSSLQRIVSQDGFQSMAQNLRDMMLKPQDREAAELALRKIRCARPEWKLKSDYGFNLKCD